MVKRKAASSAAASTPIGTDGNGTVAEADNYKVLRWKIKADSKSIRHFFIKEHRCKTGSSIRKPQGKTVIVMNVPPYITEELLKEMFSIFGQIVDVFIHQTPTINIPQKDDPYFPDPKNIITGYRIAYIVFHQPSTVKDILKLKPKDIPPLILGDAKTGLQKWVSDYNSRLVDVSVLESNVKSFMAKYEKEEIRKKEDEKNNDGQPDEDGWITVTRKGKRPGAIRTEKMEERLKAKKRKQEKQVVKYTPTQIKESRATQLLELKKKFDEDKQRVTLMKQKRKFKPF